MYTSKKDSLGLIYGTLFEPGYIVYRTEGWSDDMSVEEG